MGVCAVLNLAHGCKVRSVNAARVGVSSRGAGTEDCGIDLAVADQVYAGRANVVCLHQDVLGELPLDGEIPLDVIRWPQVRRKRGQRNGRLNRSLLERVRGTGKRIRVIRRVVYSDAGETRRRRKLRIELRDS